MVSMTHEAEALLEKALSLPENERAELASNLIASLDTNVDPDTDAAWQEEVARRRPSSARYCRPAWRAR